MKMGEKAASLDAISKEAVDLVSIKYTNNYTFVNEVN